MSCRSANPRHKNLSITKRYIKNINEDLAAALSFFVKRIVMRAVIMYSVSEQTSVT